MTNVMMMPSAANLSPVVLGGVTQAQTRRTYSGGAGAIVSVPFADDVAQLLGHGWIALPGAGTTLQRPTSLGGSPLPTPTFFVDTTLSATIVWDGASWRDTATGNAV